MQKCVKVIGLLAHDFNQTGVNITQVNCFQVKSMGKRCLSDQQGGQ
jgi:hypothetical protein